MINKSSKLTILMGLMATFPLAAIAFGAETTKPPAPAAAADPSSAIEGKATEMDTLAKQISDLDAQINAKALETQSLMLKQKDLQLMQWKTRSELAAICEQEGKLIAKPPAGRWGCVAKELPVSTKPPKPPKPPASSSSPDPAPKEQKK